LVCDYVVIISGGKLVAAQQLQDMGLATGDLLVRVDGDRAAFADRLNGLGIRVTEPSDDELRSKEELQVAFTGDEVYDVIRDTAADLGLSLRSLRQKGRSLEDLYLGNIGEGSPNGVA